MNIKGFKDLNKDKDNKDKKDDKKTTNSYTGGASSGLNVENPDDMEKIELTVYRNGFKINNGEFRDVQDPKNKEFMDEVQKGYIPQEFVKKGYKNLGIALNKVNDDYVPPKEEKKFKAFEGTGQSLSDNTESVEQKINSNINFSVDSNEPITRISFRLHNGEIISQVFNLTHTVNDIRIFLNQAAPVFSAFDLLEGFPPRPLKEDSKTIKDLKLEGTTLIQRLA